MILIIFGVSLGVFLKDVVPAAKQGLKKEAWVHGILICAGFVVLVLWALRVEVPSPLLPVQRLIERMLKG